MTSLSMTGGTSIDMGMLSSSSQTATPNGVAGVVNSPQDNSNISAPSGNISPGTPSQTGDLGGGSPGTATDSRGSVSSVSGSVSGGPPPSASSMAASVESGTGGSVSSVA